MTRDRPTRRHVLAASAASLAVPAILPAQTVTGGAGFVRFAAACRALSGFDPLPRPLVTGLFDMLGPDLAEAIAENAADADTEARVLRGLYTGILPPAGEGGAARRIAYADALMFAAAEETLNVPTYCGGLPNFWKAPPDRAS